MPGIVGIIKPGRPEERQAGVDTMLASMMHESFYRSATYNSDELRCSIGWVFHEEAVGMPLWNKTGSVGLVFSGENFSDDSRDDERGPCDKGIRDVVGLYEKRGPRVLEQLNGWFSGVLLDRAGGQVLLFNDRYGVNRIYFHEAGEAFYFSSEVKALQRILPDLRRLDYAAVGEFLSCGCVLRNKTLFAGVSVVPGGSAWVFPREGRPRRESFFQKEEWEEQAPLSELDFQEKLKQVWGRILPRYMRSRSPVGLSLTGGVDSRMILAWARSAPGELPCYTFCGNYRTSNDVRIARMLASSCQQEHSTIAVNDEFFATFQELAARTVYLSDGAMDVTGALDLFVQRPARQISPVRLGGVYGGEILRRLVVFKPFALHPGLLAPEMAQSVLKGSVAYTNELQAHPLSFTAFKQAPWYMTAKFSIERSQLTLRSPYFDNDLVALAYRAPAASQQTNQVSLELIQEGNPALADIATDRGRGWGSMPLIGQGRHLFEQFLFKAEYAYDYGMPQWLARLDHVLSPFQLERLFLGRHGATHFRVWYRDQLSPYVKEILLDPRTLGRPYLDARVLERIVGAHTKGVGNYTLEISKLLTIELIQRLFVDGKN